MDLEVQISWQVQYFVDLEVQISWHVQYFVGLDVQTKQFLRQGRLISSKTPFSIAAETTGRQAAEVGEPGSRRRRRRLLN